MIDLSGFKFRKILIIGGTGTFGQACTDYLLKRVPDINIRILSRDEYKQDLMAKRLNFDSRIVFMLGDARDKDRVLRAMHDVDLVLSAFALKQIPAGEKNVDEFIKTNINANMSVGEAAIIAKVPRLIFLSTDKVVYPQTAYGTTKLAAERFYIGANQYSPHTDFIITRYGNILKSRGSVVPFFLDLINKNKKLTVTDLGSSRFMMLVKESVELVLCAAIYGSRGDIFVPKLPSFMMKDLVEAIIGKFDINDIDIIGLRTTEKLHERLMMDEEISRSFMISSNITGIIPVYVIPDKPLNELPSFGAEYSKPNNYSSNEWDFVERLNVENLIRLIHNE